MPTRSPGESGARRSAPRQRPPTAHPESIRTTPAPDPPDTERAGGATTSAVNPHEHTPGHPRARGTLPMARYLTDPAIEAEIQALAREAPPMTEDQRARLARLLRLNRRRDQRAA